MNAAISASVHNDKKVVVKYQSRRLIDPNRYFQLAEKHLRFLSHIFSLHLVLFGKKFK